MLNQEEILSKALQESLLGVAELHIISNEMDDRKKSILTEFTCLPGWTQKFLVRKRYNSN